MLYSMFFENYTENLWGRHPSEIDPSWGAQRAKGLSVMAIIKDMFGKLLPNKKNRHVETSLIESFKYPKLGPGELWDVTAAEVEKLGYSFTEVKDQATALMEVAAGTADAAVIDSLMAGAMVGEGTGYDSLTSTVSLNAEEGEQYGVGFRQGSDLAQALNDFFAASYADGSMVECAETYGIQAALIAQ